MEFAEVVRKRRMVRHFTPEPVPRETIERMLDLTRHAPSAGFTQGQSFVVVTDPEMKRRVAELCGEQHYVEAGFGPWISQAPVLYIPCTSEEAYHRRYREPDKIQADGTEIEWPVPYWFMDIGCAVQILLMAAVDEGLSAGFAGAWDLDAVRALLGIPAEVTPVGVIPVGHGTADKPSPSLKRGRKAEGEYAHWERW
ncbi:MAG TPA: nitroreductase family protein [Chloroflexia bacterium]|nr:nitroreductase family protein [Chloroflexia bacterium]